MMLEKVAATNFSEKQLKKRLKKQRSTKEVHLALNGLYGRTQSAYRKNHSVETAMVGIYNDLLVLLAADRGEEDGAGDAGLLLCI